MKLKRLLAVLCYLLLFASPAVAKDVTLNMTRSEIEDTARDTNGWRSYIPGLAEWTIDFMLLKKYPESTAMAAIRTAFINGTVLATVQIVDSSGYGWTGDVAVTNFTENQPYEDALAIDCTFRGRGVPTQVTPSS